MLELSVAQLVCRASTFHRIGAAHALLNGVVKGFWKLIAGERKGRLEQGNDLRMTSAQKQKVASRVRQLHATSGCNKAIPDLTACDPVLPLELYSMPSLCMGECDALCCQTRYT